MPKVTRVLLGQHQTLFRRSLAVLLNQRPGMRVVGKAATGAQALALARVLNPHVIVVDLEVPQGGPQLIEDLCREPAGRAVLVLADSRQDSLVRSLLRLGARGYFWKVCEPEDLIQAICLIQAGETVMTPVPSTAPGDLGEGPSDGSLPRNLADRECDFVVLVSQGFSNHEIARRLCITERTVKGHLAKILHTLGLSNRVQLATYALEQGMTASYPSVAIKFPARVNGSSGR